MSNKLQLQVLLQAVDKITRPVKNIIQTQSKLQKNTRNLQQTLTNDNATLRQIGSYQKLHAGLGKTASQMSVARQKASQLGTAIKAGSLEGQKHTQQLKKLQNQISKLVTKHSQQKSAINATRFALKSAGVDTRKLSDEQKRLANVINKTNTALGKHNHTLEQVQARTKKLALARDKYQKAMQHKANIGFIGAAAYATGTRAFSFIKQAASIGIEYDSIMSRVAAKSEILKGSEDFHKLDKLSKHLGATTTFKASEVAEAMEMLAQAGKTVPEIEKMISSMLDLSKVSGSDTAFTADFATNVLGQFRLAADQMPRVVDVLAKVSVSSNLSMTQLAGSLEAVGPVAKEFGSTLEETATIVGLLANVGVKSEKSGVAMRRIFTNIAAHAPARDALEELGIAINNAQGKARGIDEIFKDVAIATKDMGNVQAMQIFKDIAGMHAISSFSSLTRDQIDNKILTYLNKIRQTKDGFSKDMAKQFSDNAEGDLKAYESAIEAVNLSLWSGQRGAFRETIQSITILIRSANEWINKNPELASTFVKIATYGAVAVTGLGMLAIATSAVTGGFAALRFMMFKFTPSLIGFIFKYTGAQWLLNTALWASGGALKLIGRGMWFLAGGTIMKIIKMVRSWAAVQWLLNIALNANPLGLIVIACGAVIAAGVAVYTYWDELVSWFTTAFSWLGNKISGILSWFTSFFSDDEVNKTINMVEKHESQPAIQKGKELQSKLLKSGGIPPINAQQYMPKNIHSMNDMQGMPNNVSTQKTPYLTRQSHNIKNENIINVTVNPSQGMSEQDIAKKITQSIDDYFYTQKTNKQSRLYDDFDEFSGVMP